MYKVIKIVENIPLTEIKQMEDDGVDAYERIKMQMAVQIVRDLPKELFDKLFKTTILNPNNTEQLQELQMRYVKNPTSYNEANFKWYKELKNRELAEIEIILEIEI
jgi:hypothetical protein